MRFFRCVLQTPCLFRALLGFAEKILHKYKISWNICFLSGKTAKFPLVLLIFAAANYRFLQTPLPFSAPPGFASIIIHRFLWKCKSFFAIIQFFLLYNQITLKVKKFAAPKEWFTAIVFKYRYNGYSEQPVRIFFAFFVFIIKYGNILLKDLVFGAAEHNFKHAVLKRKSVFFEYFDKFCSQLWISYIIQHKISATLQ